MLDSGAIDGFTESVLASRYDQPKPVPLCHKEWWELCCSDNQKVAIASPRGHGKSTAVTFAYVLACLMFRISRHVLIISATEKLAIDFLGDLKTELIENEYLIDLFGIEKIVKDSEAEVIGKFKDGPRFRIIAKGAGQRMRGVKWDHKRPDLVIGDDLEDDEIVLNQERREKFKRWFDAAVVPILGDGGKIRLVGTIVHMDSLLENLMPDLKDEDTVIEPLKVSTTKERDWVSVKYRAHDEDFKHILWPEKFPKAKLLKLREGYKERGRLEVYGQEYLNDPIDPTVAYFQDSDFLPLKEAERRNYAAIDFAIAQNQRSDFTAIVVGGMTSDSYLDIVHARRGRWDALDIIENMFQIQKRFDIDLFFAEDGAIKKSIGPFLNEQMLKRGEFINLITMTPTKDKVSRSRSLQARMRAGGVRFDKDADWFPDLHEEMRRFPKGQHDDYVDAIAWLGLGIEEQVEAPTAEELAEEEYEDMIELTGRSAVTGY